MKHSNAFVKLVEEVMPDIREISPEDVKRRLDRGSDFVLVDVREDGEWEKGRIIGSIHLGRGVIERDIEGIIEDKSKEVVLYCGEAIVRRFLHSTFKKWVIQMSIP